MTDDDGRITIGHDCTPAERAAAQAILGGHRLELLHLGRVARALRSNLLGWVLFIICAMTFFWMLRHRTSRQVAPRALLADLPLDAVVAVAVFTLGAICSVVSFVLVAVARRAEARRWQGQLRYSFGAHGITQQRPGRADAFSWERFCGVDETHELLIVRDAPKHGIVLPKRLFASDAETKTARRMLHENVVRRETPPAPGDAPTHS